MSTRSRLLLDALLLFAFVAASNPAVTGLAVHEWLCLIAIAPVLWHTIINWDWVVRTATSFIDTCRAASRVNLIVDALLFVATVAVMVSGFAVSRTLASVVGLSTSAGPMWHSLHAFSADAVLALFALHTVLHWRWVFNAARSLAGAIEPRREPAIAMTPVAASGRTARASAPPAPTARDHFM